MKQPLRREPYETVSFYLPRSLKERIDALVLAHETNRSYAGMVLLLEGLKLYEAQGHEQVVPCEKAEPRVDPMIDESRD